MGARRHVEAAPDLVRKPYRKVRKLGDPLTEESSGEEFHELRKKGKRLRYALEFLSGVYGEPIKEFIRPLKDLQDVLGDHQDAEVATSHLRELSVARGRGRRLPPETIFVMGGISHRYEIQARGLRTRYPEAYRNAVRKKWKKIRGALENTDPSDSPINRRLARPLPTPCDDAGSCAENQRRGKIRGFTSASVGCERFISIMSAGSPAFCPARPQPVRSRYGVGEVSSSIRSTFLRPESLRALVSSSRNSSKGSTRTCESEPTESRMPRSGSPQPAKTRRRDSLPSSGTRTPRCRVRISGPTPLRWRAWRGL